MNFRNRNFLKLLDFDKAEIQRLIDFSKKLKNDKKGGYEQKYLPGKNIALIFEKSSTRTHCAFEVAAYDQGANITYLDSNTSQIRLKESIKDTARVLGRMYDAIEYRGFEQNTVEELGKFAGVPVWNGLTDQFHPTQVLADFLTMIECTGKPLNQLKLAFIGDARNNVANSLLVGAAKTGLNFVAIAPKNLWPDDQLIQTCQDIAKLSGAELEFTSNPIEGVKDCDFIYTDVWLSMGEPEHNWNERIQQLKPYQVNAALMRATDNIHTRFMHCLPANHNTETVIGKAIYDQYGLECMEVSDEVFESKQSLVFEQAENRLHTIKAIMVATLSNIEL